MEDTFFVPDWRTLAIILINNIRDGKDPKVRAESEKTLLKMADKLERYEALKSK